MEQLEENLFRLFSGEDVNPVFVCRISPRLISEIGAFTGCIWLSRQTMEKQFVKHGDLTIDHYLMLPWVIEHGIPVRDRDRHLTFVYDRESKFGRYFKATIKATVTGTEIYVQSFHTISRRKIKRILARGPAIPK